MNEERILSIDYGRKRVGLAITDPLKIFAYPFDTLTNDTGLIDKLKLIIEEKHVVKIILGDPVREDGKISVMKREIEKFKRLLTEKTAVDIELVDERYTSELAKQRILETITSKKRRRDKSLVDKNAAAIMLEDYLKENP